MLTRVTDSSLPGLLANRIGQNRVQLETVQEQIATGKRINRPSDDPTGAEAVLRSRTAQAVAEQFQQNALAVKDNLQIADGSMESYSQLQDRARSLLTQGASDGTSAAGKQAIATEIDQLRQQMLSIANSASDGHYTFGGTRQNVPPFDSTGAPAATPTFQQLVQVEPGGTPIPAGVTADTIFSNANGTIFSAMSNASAALRGTGDPVADHAAIAASMDSLTSFVDQAGIARSQLGASMNAVDDANSRLQALSLSFQATADRYEAVDLATAAVQLTQADRAYQATLQASVYSGRKSLIDFLS